jgi:ferredoxin
MNDTVHLIYFSPTGTTRKVVEAIAAGTGAKKIRSHDLTLGQVTFDRPLEEGFAVIGVPVYAGRVPEICLERLQGIAAQGMPAALVTLYGNRAFEDALVELEDFALAHGFSVIAAAAFIGEHSYATPAHPVAAGRPDAADLLQARAFGADLAALLAKGVPGPGPLIPGDRPYRERPPRGPIAPETDPGLCTTCGTCVSVCPTSAISLMGSTVQTDATVCLLCCACVKRCPEQARALNHPLVATRREMLTAQCSARKEPFILLSGLGSGMKA